MEGLLLLQLSWVLLSQHSNASTYRDTHVHIPRCQTGSGVGMGEISQIFPSYVGSTKTQRKMKYSMWSSVSRLSHFILTSSFHHLTASVLNSSSCWGCALFRSWQDTSLCVSLLVHLALCHSLPTSECHHENMCKFNPPNPKLLWVMYTKACHIAVHGPGPWTAK